MAEPITLAQAKQHMRIDADDTSQDDLIALYITANREYLERYLNLSLIEKDELVYKFNRGCTCRVKYLYVPYGPVASFVLTDKAGDVIPDTDYTNLGDEQFPKFCINQSATVTYDAGYSVEDCPSQVKQALLIMVADSYENRENTVIGMSVNTIPFTAKQLVYNLSRNLIL